MTEAADFHGLGLNEALVKKLAELNMVKPTRVQAESIPAILEGRNLLVQSPTGTGKTLAYLAPFLSSLDPQSRELQVLVLVPSRELAVQVVRTVKSLTEDIRVVSLIGGANLTRQLEALKEKPQMAVGTPGRVWELLQKRKINGQAVTAVVVDEADKMFSAGFMEDVRAILKATLKSRQVLFFSATIPYQLREMAPELMQDPCYLNFGEEGRVPDTITHLYFLSRKEQKLQTLVQLLRIYKPHKAIVFIQRNEGVNPLAGKLKELGLEAVALHGDQPPQIRREVLEKFRLGKAKVLVTTDLLARGMDIPDVDYIFNYDLPLDEKHYLHRVGRTGRAGRSGTAVTLLGEEQKHVIPKLARTLGIQFTQMGLAENKVFPVVYKRARGKSGSGVGK